MWAGKLWLLGAPGSGLMMALCAMWSPRGLRSGSAGGAVSAASEPPFLDREHEKPYYLSNIRHPLERNLFAASLQNM